MTSRSPQDILQELENDVTNRHYGRADVLHEVATGYERAGDEEKAGNLRAEAATFALSTRQRGRVFPGYYQPWYVSSEGHTVPDKAFFDGDTLDHLSARARVISNPIHAARFADVVWDLASPKDPAMARLAVTKYVECIDLYRTNGWGTYFGDAIKRAAALAAMVRDVELLALVKERVLRYMRELDSSREYRFCQDLATVLAEVPRIELDSTEWQEVVAIVDRAATYYQAEHPERRGSFGPVDGPREKLVRSFHEKRIALANRSGLIDADTERAAIAESYEREGDLQLKGDNALAAVVFYLQAEQAFKDLGMSGDMYRARVKLRDAGLRSEQQMETFSVEVPIETSELECYFEPLLGDDLPDTLERIANSSHFIPDLDETQQSAERDHETYLGHRLFGRISFSGEYTVARDESDEELRKAMLKDHLLNHIQVATVFRTYLFDKMRERYEFNADTLIDYFRGWGICKPRNLMLMKRGFERYFADDCISALHILVPQFEDTLRSLLGAANRPIARPLHGTATLGALLDDTAFKRTDDENLHHYYELVMLEDGLNLRNGVAHGLIEPEAMTQSAVELVMHLLLTLTGFSPEEIASEEQSS